MVVASDNSILISSNVLTVFPLSISTEQQFVLYLSNNMWKCALLSFLLAQMVGLVPAPHHHNYYYPPSSELPTNHDSKCSLGIIISETLQLGEVICGQTEVTLEMWKGVCLNGGSECETHHYAFKCFETESYCLPLNRQTVIQSVQITGPSCQETIQVRMENITSCECTTRTTSASCS